MEKIKVGIAGLGRIGQQSHVPLLMAIPEKYEIVALADEIQERIDTVKEKLPNAKGYLSVDDMIADPNVDFVIIALRHNEHVPYSIKALEAGKYVLCEKPIAVNYAEMMKLKEVSEKYPKKLFLRQNRRFEPIFVKLQEFVATGVLGDITMVKTYRSCGYCRRNDWMTMSEYSGGLLTNWGPHMLDQVLTFLKYPIKDVWADLKSVISIGDGDDQMKILLRDENGVVADVEISGTQTLSGREWEIRGSRGSVYYDPKEGNYLYAKYVDPSCEFKSLQPHPETPRLEYGNFDEKLTFIESKIEIPTAKQIEQYIYETILEGKEFPIKFEHAAEVVRLTDEIFRVSGFNHKK